MSLSGGDLNLVEKVLNVQKDLRMWSFNCYDENRLYFPRKGPSRENLSIF